MIDAFADPDAALSETLRQDPADLGRHPCEEEPDTLRRLLHPLIVTR